MLSYLRKTVTPIKMALAGPLARAKVHPNTVTLAALPFSLAAMGLAAQGHYWLGLAMAFPAALADFLDGAVAELQSLSSPQGNFLEACVDRTVDGFLLAGLAVRYPILCMVALTLSFSVSYIKARVGLVVETDNSDWPGWGDRTDRVAVTMLGYLAAGFSWQAGHAVVVALIVLSLVGTLQRLRHGLKLIDAAQKEGKLLSYLR